jgi:hypothetical protein
MEQVSMTLSRVAILQIQLTYKNQILAWEEIWVNLKVCIRLIWMAQSSREDGQ